MAIVAWLLIGPLMREDETLVFGQWNNARNVFFIKRGNKWFVHELGYSGDVQVTVGGFVTGMSTINAM